MTKKKKEVIDEVTLSVPNETMDHTLSKHDKSYWEKARNGTLTPPTIENFDLDVMEILESVTGLLKQKNKAYGNTALNPTNVFSKLDATEAICARIDDKLARISNKGLNDKTEDTVDDLIGYLVLLKIALRGRK